MKQVAMNMGPAGKLSPQEIEVYQQQLQPEIERVAAARWLGYETKYASVNLPFDQALIDEVQAVVRDKQKKRVAALIVIGIGGSSLGTKAVHEALNGLYYNEKTTATKLYFVETVDTQGVADVLMLVQALLERGEHILVNLISKSGSTTETIANYELFLQLLKSYYPTTWHEQVVVTTDYGSLLWRLAHEQQLTSLTIPALVGGRYSVFSAVGLFPLAFLGVDLQGLVAGAQSMVTAGTQLSLEHNTAALSAASIVEHYRQGLTIHDIFLFSVELAAVGSWYRQLVGESLGKSSTTGVEVGITPTVSIGSIDLHSVGQLYLGGPKKASTTFVTVQTDHEQCVLPWYPEFESLVAHIQGKSLSALMDAIIHGTLAAYTHKQLPYLLFQLPEKNAYAIGQLLQLKMLEVMYIGHLLAVNPFDQPHVEKYKVETRKILAHE
ncbi:hypothetical protein JST99_00755 [Candidatus Dependentiae bacterium]|nr:hypothetical protein [Candidatus Dependentiae bacterium]MCC7414855.1 hypothetical protein [Campylobacterota bacterium]